MVVNAEKTDVSLDSSISYDRLLSIGTSQFKYRQSKMANAFYSRSFVISKKIDIFDHYKITRFNLALSLPPSALDRFEFKYMLRFQKRINCNISLF